MGKLISLHPLQDGLSAQSTAQLISYLPKLPSTLSQILVCYQALRTVERKASGGSYYSDSAVSLFCRDHF